jgi:hypothetical protein
MTHDRRMFLRSALASAGGLLLPLRGSGAFALDLSHPKVPVASVGIPRSAEGLELSRLRAVLAEIHDRPNSDARTESWRQTMHAYRAIIDQICARPVYSWNDCIDLAEVGWHISDKEPDPNGRLRLVPCRQTEANDTFTRARHALFEAVLTLGQGERVDPKSVSRYGVVTAHA